MKTLADNDVLKSRKPIRSIEIHENGKGVYDQLHPNHERLFETPIGDILKMFNLITFIKFKEATPNILSVSISKNLFNHLRDGGMRDTPNRNALISLVFVDLIMSDPNLTETLCRDLLPIIGDDKSIEQFEFVIIGEFRSGILTYKARDDRRKPYLISLKTAALAIVSEIAKWNEPVEFTKLTSDEFRDIRTDVKKAIYKSIIAKEKHNTDLSILDGISTLEDDIYYKKFVQI